MIQSGYWPDLFLKTLTDFHKTVVTGVDQRLECILILAKHPSPLSKTRVFLIRSPKSDHTTSNYLDLTRVTAERKKLVKTTKSNHKIIIELDKYNQTIRDNRNCPFCGSNEIEGEIHFLFNCFFKILFE